MGKKNFDLFSVSVAGTGIKWGPNHNFETLILKRCEKVSSIFISESFFLREEICLHLKIFDYVYI